MNRRSFIRSGAAAGAALSVGPVSASSQTPDSQDIDEASLDPLTNDIKAGTPELEVSNLTIIEERGSYWDGGLKFQATNTSNGFYDEGLLSVKLYDADGDRVGKHVWPKKMRIGPGESTTIYAEIDQEFETVSVLFGVVTDYPAWAEYLPV